MKNNYKLETIGQTIIYTAGVAAIEYCAIILVGNAVCKIIEKVEEKKEERKRESIKRAHEKVVAYCRARRS